MSISSAISAYSTIAIGACAAAEEDIAGDVDSTPASNLALPPQAVRSSARETANKLQYVFLINKKPPFFHHSNYKVGKKGGIYCKGLKIF